MAARGGDRFFWRFRKLGSKGLTPLHGPEACRESSRMLLLAGRAA